MTKKFKNQTMQLHYRTTRLQKINLVLGIVNTTADLREKTLAIEPIKKIATFPMTSQVFLVLLKSYHRSCHHSNVA